MQTPPTFKTDILQASVPSLDEVMSGMKLEKLHAQGFSKGQCVIMFLGHFQCIFLGGNAMITMFYVFLNLSLFL